MNSSGKDLRKSLVEGFQPGGQWSLWDMLQSYFPIYQIALNLQELRRTAELYKSSGLNNVSSGDAQGFHDLLQEIHQKCLEYKLSYTAVLAKRISERPPPKTYADMLSELNHLNDSLSHQLENEAVFRVPPERKDYFERDDLFGPKVAAAFPSCERDIRKAGSCYALEQEDACVHHLMLVLERGLNVLAAKVGVSYQYAQWQVIINEIEKELKSLPRGTQREFYHAVNAHFGFLKEAYRKHSAHTRDDPYDMPKALSILNHVKEFMQVMEKGGLAE